MARPKVKVSEARSFRIRKDLGTRLDDYSEWSHIPKTVIVELALEEYLNKVAPVKKIIKTSMRMPQRIQPFLTSLTLTFLLI